MKANGLHIFYLLLPGWVGLSLPLYGQELSATTLINLLSANATKTESQLKDKGYTFAGWEIFGDTSFKTYQYQPSRNKSKNNPDSATRKFILAALKETYTLSYQTTSASEYSNVLGGLKKQGFYCAYEKESSAANMAYLYQHGEFTADVCKKNLDGIDWYCFTFFKKILPSQFKLENAEALFSFTSHEFLVHYFGEENVKKDLYYFSQYDIASCSVLFIKTNRQVVFIWRDGLNKRTIANLLLGGQQSLQSQLTSEDVVAENIWRMNNGLRIGMNLIELQTLNDKEIAFVGGNSPKTGLVLPESSGKIDFNNIDVILGCNNCTDNKFLMSKKMSGNDAMQEGRILFVQGVVLYPLPTGVFE